MSHDHQLIETIKSNLVRKSSAQLQEIVQAKNQDRWSPEAITAAGEVLQDRMAGRAQEPQVAEEEEPTPPASGHDVNSLAFIVGLNAFTFPLGFIVMPTPGATGAREEDDVARDQPVPFGSKVAWLAVDTVDTAGVATALGLREAREATWEEGIDAAYQSSVFITPPLGEWTLAVGTALFPPNRAEEFVKPLLERLSRQFGDAQYFCTRQDVELHIWARARMGRLLRGFGWLGQKGLTLWDEGGPTKEERDLGFRFFEGRSPAVDKGHDGDPTLLNEDSVMQLACLWSIDPTTLDEHFKEPLLGLLGNVAR